MKYWSLKSLGTSFVAAACALVLYGCAAAPPASENAAAINDERCVVTGSNLPSRRCRMDVIIVAPGSLDSGVTGSRPPGGATR